MLQESLDKITQTAIEKNWCNGSGKMNYHGLILFISLEGEALGTVEVLGNNMSWMDLLHICKIENMW